MSRFLIGTIGEGLWVSDDGQRWRQAPDIPREAALYSFVVAGSTIFAGGTGCVYRGDGARFDRLALPDPELQAWALAVEPARPSTIFVGCRPLSAWRSGDSGTHWTALPIALSPDTPRPHTPRVTAILIEPDAMWCGVEVGGIFHSTDRGESWSAVNDGLPSLDVHALARSRTLLAATPRGIARLDDGWHRADLKMPWQYCRALAPVPGRPGHVLCGLGDAPPGTKGAVAVSEDGGRSWQAALLPGIAESTIWSVAVAPDDGDLALAAGIRGELFLSEDAGRQWARLPRRFTEIRAVLVMST